MSLPVWAREGEGHRVVLVVRLALTVIRAYQARPIAAMGTLGKAVSGDAQCQVERALHGDSDNTKGRTSAPPQADGQSEAMLVKS